MNTRYDALISRRTLVVAAGLGSGLALVRPSALFAAENAAIEPQPYFASVSRAIEAMKKLGAPLSATDTQQMDVLIRQSDSVAINAAEQILARYTLVKLSVDFKDNPVHLTLGGAPNTLVEQGWRMFLVRISNQDARMDNLVLLTGFRTPGAMLPGNDFPAQRANLMDTLNNGPLIEKMWLMTRLYGTSPLIRYSSEVPTIPLSGIPVEYGVIQVFSRDSGRRNGEFSLYTLARAGEGITAFGRRTFGFDCVPSRTVTLGVLDTDGRGCMASLTIKDELNHIYPPQGMRLAPDMSFHSHIYRADGENMRLPDGNYTIESRRGPEYLRGIQTVKIDADHARIEVKLERWVDPTNWGWYSGDTHIHAAGCKHYQVPTQGVSPETMIRHVRGEGLWIGDVLSWGPSWYYQKQFFTGHAESPAATLEHPDLQAANNATLQPHATSTDSASMLRYDVEVSGFPSSHAGHVVLLRLKEQDYPGTTLIEEWPSWTLPILQWARAQGAVVGAAHCGSGLTVESNELPNYEIPPMDGVGAQETIIDVTHGAVDFLSGCDTRPVAELNVWYHMLNCGFRLAMVGETDYPCIWDERPGMGRSYVRLDQPPLGDAGYDAWIRGIQQGRLYCGDGRSHFLDFKVNGVRSGESDLTLKAASTLNIEALVAARLEPDPPAKPVSDPLGSWHLENARIGTTRTAAVELVVNGVAVESRTFVADGTARAISFQTRIERSSWVALRILPSAHTHPVFVQVAGKPIRASKRSAQWCRACVDKVWEVKAPFMRASERAAAAQAFDHARHTYEKIAADCEVT